MKQILENIIEKSKEVLGLQSYPIIGVDIGTDAVKMVGLCKNGDGYHVTAVAMCEIESADSSKEPSANAITAAIEECLKASGEKISRNCHFVLGLAGPMVKVSSFNFTSMTLEEIDQAVMFEAEQVCPFDIRTSVVDYQLIGVDKTDTKGVKKKNEIHASTTGVLAVASEEVIAKRQKLAEDALLKCVLMDSEGLALLNCLEDYLGDDDELPVAVVNIGRELTTVAILGEDGLPFIRDLRHCGNDIIEHIAKGCGISVKQVEEKLSAGQRPPEFIAGIDQACNRLVLDIKETLSYHLTHHSGNTLQGVYVCGDFLLVDDFARVLANSIDDPVTVWNPFLNMSCDDNIAGSELVGQCGTALVVAAGLAMRQI